MVKTWIRLFAAAFIVFSSAPAQTVIANIPYLAKTGNFFNRFARLDVNETTNKIYASTGTGAVFVIDGATNIVSTIPDPNDIPGDEVYPSNLAVNSVTDKIYVLHPENQFITEIDGGTGQIVTITNPNFQPNTRLFLAYDIQVNPVTNKIYTIQFQYSLPPGQGTVTVIDGATHQTATVTDSGMIGPQFILVNSSSNKIYIFNLRNTVTVIDGATNKATTVDLKVSNPSLVFGAAINPVSNKIYVVTQPEIDGVTSNTLSVLDGATNQVTTVSKPGLKLGGVVGVNSKVNKIYLPYYAPNSPIPSNLLTIDGKTNQTIDDRAVSASPTFASNLLNNRLYGSTYDLFGAGGILSIDGSTNNFTTVATPLTGGLYGSPVVNRKTSRFYAMGYLNGLEARLLVAEDTNGKTLPSFSMGESSINFGSRPIGLQAIKHVTVQNTGTLPVQFASLQMYGENYNDFAITDNTCPATLSVGASCNLVVTFQPSDTGFRHGLMLYSPIEGVAQQIVLFGPGVPALPSGPLSFNPPLIEWGPVNVGITSHPIHIMVTNPTPGTTAVLAGVTLTGRNASDFHIVANTCPGTIPYHGGNPSCEVDVVFAPTAAGGRITNLTFADNGSNPPQFIPIEGPAK